MMKIPSVKGTRDFYPDEMAVRNHIAHSWREASEVSGFVEYDGPIFEHLDLFTIKSGEEIVEQLFSLTDRGGRRLAIRPEITPTLARMVNARAAALPRPIKWFSIPRLCRAERPQRGRLREFFQWNIDIIGAQDTDTADAECVFVAVDGLRRLGLTTSDIVVRISSRDLLAELLTASGFAADRLGGVYAVLDKRDKLPPDVFSEKLQHLSSDPTQRTLLEDLGAATGPEGLQTAARWAGEDTPAAEAFGRLKHVLTLLDAMGVGEFIHFDMGIVRGLAYYTGVVFEIFDRTGQERRAITGGGRYDDLLALLGGPKLSGMGFGTGDVILTDLLKTRNLLPTQSPGPEVFVIAAGENLSEPQIRLVARLREKGVHTDFSYRRSKLARQLRTASDRRARLAVIVGQETVDAKKLTVKTLDTGDQKQIDMENFIHSLEKRTDNRLST